MNMRNSTDLNILQNTHRSTV